MLVTAWLSTATAASLGAEPQARHPGSHALESQAPESPTLRLRFADGLLSLEATQRPYAEVLGAIQKETGIRFHYTIPMAEAVTVSLQDVPVQEALKRLVGREAQLMFRFPEGPSTAGRAGVPEEVWILGTVSGPMPEASGPAEKSAALVGESGDAAAHSPDTTSPANERQPDANPATSEQPDIESLIETTQSEDPNLRLQAFSALIGLGRSVGSGRADQGAVNEALNAALTDEDAVVRAQAVQALVRQGGPEATSYLEQALRDQDPGVRVMALQSLDPARHGVDLIKQALSDADPAVRAMAEAMLHPEAQ
ncbi:MAG: HEAT repeat domain-containing protein [Pseudomonadota bacterium]|nr:HEAT repeat domain-containing protein [Gammaproteobacteria bacterium]MDQ3580995.1 HEAT repeat domain-containing protein [Pseudomonadota bacterium]